MRATKILIVFVLIFAAVSLHVLASNGISKNLVKVTYPGENGLQEGQVRVSGGVGALPDSSKYTVINVDTGVEVSGKSSNDGSFSTVLVAEPGHVLDLQITDIPSDVDFASFVSSYTFMVKGGSSTASQFQVDMNAGYMLTDDGINMAASGNWFQSAFTSGFLFKWG